MPQTATQPVISPPLRGAVRDGIAAAREMKKVTGIGGFFFRAHQLHPGLPKFPPRHLVLSSLEMLTILLLDRESLRISLCYPPYLRIKCFRSIKFMLTISKDDNI